MTDSQNPTQQRTIDPYPVIGDVINHFEAMLQANAVLTDKLLSIVRENNLMNKEIDDAANEMYRAFSSYWAFKSTLPRVSVPEVNDGK